jgi:hypothetical protein
MRIASSHVSLLSCILGALLAKCLVHKLPLTSTAHTAKHPTQEHTTYTRNASRLAFGFGLSAAMGILGDAD